MSLSSLMARAFATLALSAGAAHAAPAPLQGATDPQAAVPATTYEPAIRYRTAPPPTGTPDRNWLASNAAVTRQEAAAHGGHAGHAGHAAMAGQAAPQQCMPAGKGAASGCCANMQHGQHMQHGQQMSDQQCHAGGGCACCQPPASTPPTQPAQPMQHMHGAHHQHGAAS